MSGDRAALADKGGDVVPTPWARHSSMKKPGVFVPLDGKPRAETLAPKRQAFGVSVLEALDSSTA